MRYRCETVSVEGFIQQLAVAYVSRGYLFYVTGVIPERKDPRRVDEKLVARFGIDLSKWAKARRKQQGQANLQYLRHGRFFVLLASHGEHRFFAEEPGVQDVRRVSIKFGGYAVGFRGGHVQVRIHLPVYRERKAWFEEYATKRGVEVLARAFYELPFEPYFLVRQQEFALLRAVNRRRKAAGLPLVPSECIWLKRRPVKPFGDGCAPPVSARVSLPRLHVTPDPEPVLLPGGTSVGTLGDPPLVGVVRASGGATVPCSEKPVTAADDPPFGGVRDRRGGPLHHVPVHVVQAEGVRRKGPDR